METFQFCKNRGSYKFKVKKLHWEKIVMERISETGEKSQTGEEIHHWLWGMNAPAPSPGPGENKSFKELVKRDGQLLWMRAEFR